MTIDFERMPVGERGWTAFLEWVQALDDRYERHYLELKTAIDLTAKADRHKVAKFILAASNRDQSKAAKYFDGRALMVLGLGDSEPRGVGPFEMEELEAEVVKFIGVEGPQWDLHRIPLGNRRDIVVIIVDPPTGRIWPSLRDGNKLADGDIYIRVDGASRKAKGPEVQAMLRRSLVSPRALDVDVALNGAATVIRIDRGDLRALGRNIAQSLMADHEQATTGPYAKFSSAAATERRSAEEFRRQVEQFEQDVDAYPESGILEMAGIFGVGVRIDVTNKNDAFLQSLRIDLNFDAPVIAVPWEETSRRDFEVYPKRPLRWGKDDFSQALRAVSRVTPALPGVSDGRILIQGAMPARLAVTFAELRPRYSVSSDENDVVVVCFVEPDSTFPSQITGKWRLSAAGFDELQEGAFALDTTVADWIEPIREMREFPTADDIEGL